MFVHAVQPDDDIIKVNVAYFADVFTKGGSDTSLVYCGCIFDAHGHDEPFVQAEWGRDCGERNVVGVHSCLEETVCHVNRRPDFTFCAII